ncbi:MAG TPA: LysR family transcriptional regulator [Polyangiales bacterium]
MATQKRTPAKQTRSSAKSSSAASARLRPPRIFTYVDAVARHGSIRKAAAALHVVSSALNRRILDLEEELGTSLFERLPRGVRPTAAGELYLAYVRRSMRELSAVGAQIEGLRGMVRGRVRVAVAESVTSQLLPSAIARFQARHAGVSFHVWMDGPKALLGALLSDDADLILTHEFSSHPDVTVLAHANQPLCALVPPSHPLAERTSLSLSDCLAYPVALPDVTLAARQLLDRALLRRSLTVDPALESNSVELAKIFARWNNVVCFTFKVGQHSDVSGLVEVPLKDPGLSESQLYLVVRRSRTLPVAAAAFAHQLSEQFEAL